MLLSENVKRRDIKATEKRPVWSDSADANLDIDIDSKSRLRKLKQSEDEKTVQGDEYTKRLQETFLKLQGGHSMF